VSRYLAILHFNTIKFLFLCCCCCYVWATSGTRISFRINKVLSYLNLITTLLVTKLVTLRVLLAHPLSSLVLRHLLHLILHLLNVLPPLLLPLLRGTHAHTHTPPFCGCFLGPAMPWVLHMLSSGSAGATQHRSQVSPLVVRLEFQWRGWRSSQGCQVQLRSQKGWF